MWYGALVCWCSVIGGSMRVIFYCMVWFYVPVYFFLHSFMTKVCRSYSVWWKQVLVKKDPWKFLHGAPWKVLEEKTASIPARGYYILILEFFSFLTGLRARTIGHSFLSLSHLGYNRMPIHLNPTELFPLNFFPFLIIHKIRSRHQNTTHNTIQHSTTKYSSSSPSIFHNVR